MKILKKVLTLTPEEILDSQISDDLVKEIIIHGDVDQLTTLSKNPKFAEYDPDFFIGLSKINYPWSKNIKLQLIFFGSILAIFFILKVWAFLNLCVFGYIVYLYLYKVPAYEQRMAKDERDRRDYLERALKDTPYDISPKKS